MVNAGTTETFKIAKGDGVKNQHLNIKYYVNNSSSGEQVGIVYKAKWGESSKCPKVAPDDIMEQVKNCGSWGNEKKWQYIFSPK